MLSMYYTHYINQTINFSHWHARDDGQQTEQSKTTMKGEKGEKTCPLSLKKYYQAIIFQTEIHLSTL